MAGIEQLEQALINADAAGDAAAARILAGEITRMRSQGVEPIGPPAPAPLPDPGAATAFGRGAAQGLTFGGYDELRGLAQAGGTAANEPASLGALLRGGYNLLTGADGAPDAYRAGTDQARAELDAARVGSPLATMAGELTGGLGSGLGLYGAGASVAGNLAARGAGLAGIAGGSALDGLALGALHGAASADDGDRLTGGLAGGAVGGVIGGLAAPAAATIANALRRVASPMTVSAERQAAADVLRGEGVDLTAGQVTGSRALRNAESELGGQVAEAMMERQSEQFTRAALARAGIQAERATPDVIDNAFATIGRQFDDLAARNQIIPDQQLALDLQAAFSGYAQNVPPSQRAPIVAGIGQDLIDAMNRGAISGEAYQAVRSSLERSARQNAGNPVLANALRDMRTALDDAMERSLTAAGSPDAGAWAAVRNQYRNMLVLEKAAGSAGENAALGLISPSALRNAAKSQSLRGYVRGQGDFADLARAGEALMKPLPNSGTAGRLRAQNLGAIVPSMLGGGAGAGLGGPVGAVAGAAAGAAVPRIAGALLMSRPGQTYFQNQFLAGGAQPSTQDLIRYLTTNSGVALGP